MTYAQFKKKIWAHYKAAKRDFPWRQTHDPYKILVSEIMLQQTQTTRVREKYGRFVKIFPNFEALAEAPLRKVLKEWQGLGYNRRALNLKRAAEAVSKEYKGKFPKEIARVLALPGIGPYTAGAVMAFAFNIPFPIIETNIRTVYIHFFFKNKKKVLDKDILKLIEKTLDRKNPREWYYALMDYGVFLKQTIGNQNTRSKHYTIQMPFKGSNREIRSNILKLITQAPASEEKIIETVGKLLKKEPPEILKNISDLEKEGFIKKSGENYRIS